jgi:hypothetical protein
MKIPKCSVSTRLSMVPQISAFKHDFIEGGWYKGERGISEKNGNVAGRVAAPTVIQ